MSNCPATVPTYIDPDCGAVDGGRIVAIAFIDYSKIFTDITDAAEWVDPVYDSDIIVYQSVRGSYSPASVTEVPGKGDQDVRAVGRKHTLTVRIPSIKGNDEHFNALNKSNTYNVAWVTGSDYNILYYVDKKVSINVGYEIQEGLDSEVDHVMEVKWSDIDLPSTSDVPIGIFEPS